MTNHFGVWVGFHKTMSVKFVLWLGLMIGVFLAAPIASQAGLDFVGNGYAILNANGGGDSYYDVDNQGNDKVTPNYSGSLGGLTIQQGQSLTLGGQVQTYPGYGGPNAASSAFIGYQVVGTSISGQINLPFLQNVGSNDEWQELASASGINLDQGLAAGTYTLEVWFGGVSSDGSGTLYDNNSGANYSASFSVVVPEPVTSALPIFGGLMLAAGLGRRLVSRRVEVV